MFEPVTLFGGPKDGSVVLANIETNELEIFVDECDGKVVKNGIVKYIYKRIAPDRALYTGYEQ